ENQVFTDSLPVVKRSGRLFAAAFGPERGSKRSFIEVLDSEFERCRMRLPLIGRWFEGRRKRLSRKENFRK
ncbi:hypothetical protein Q6A58_34260, partial [Pseudomonas aeruginosa]|uniref:hypothetical protein n=1 Tax=Pseudomonas aeruginosa TaxID=287 RepID=UPI002713F30A